jgi:transcriptional regulator with XRE-family HTH domain
MCFRSHLRESVFSIMNRSAIKRELGRRVRRTRKEKQITRDALAKGCGMKTLKLRSLENGLVNPALTTLVRISRALHIRLDRLLRGIS